jgi:flagellar basal-body rod modification protein FlgD
MSLASVAAQQSAATSSSQSSTSTSGGSAALNSLSNNFNDFLSLLTTQLQNQDPTSPLDANQFTSELVQFSSVQQQINTNTSLTQLISLTQAGQVLQSSALVGKTVGVQSDHLPLENGSAGLSFTATGAQPAIVTVTSDSGTVLSSDTVRASPGANAWRWDGRDGSGRRVPDGSYRVSVQGVGADGATAALPFTVQGVVTGVAKQGQGLQLQLGALGIDFSKVQSVVQ